MSFIVLTNLPFKKILQGGIEKYVSDIGDIRITTTDVTLLDGGEGERADLITGIKSTFQYSLNLPSKKKLIPTASQKVYELVQANDSILMAGRQLSETSNSEGIITSVVSDPTSSNTFYKFSFKHQLSSTVGGVNKLEGLLNVDTFLGGIPSVFEVNVNHTITNKYGTVNNEESKMIYGFIDTASNPYDSFIANSLNGMLALSVKMGDRCYRTDLKISMINVTGNNDTIEDWDVLGSGSDGGDGLNESSVEAIVNAAVAPANIHRLLTVGNPHNVTKAEVGLSNVPNVNLVDDVAANTVAQHTHTNKAVLDTTTVAFTQDHVDTIAANTAKIGITPEQAAAIVANSVTQHTHVNNNILDATTVPFNQEYVDAIVANSAKVGITPTQAAAIVANTAKVGITAQQTTDIVSNNAHRTIVAGNPHQVTKAEVGLADVPNINFTQSVNDNSIHTHIISGNPHHVTKAEVDLGNVPNYDFTQEVTAANVHRATIGNPHQVTKADVGLPDVPNVDFTAQINASNDHITTIAGNPHQVTKADVGLSEVPNSNFTNDIIALNAHIDAVTGNPHQVTKAEIGLGNVPNVDCTNASNITTGTLPSSVLPPLAIVDTHIVNSQTDQLSLIVQKGDIAIRTDLSTTFINVSGNNTEMNDWQELTNPTDTILSVNGQVGTVILTTSNIDEGSNLYYTEERVSANIDVVANTAARHTHTNKVILDATTASFTVGINDAIVANTAKVGITPEQAAAIVANTAKIGITAQQITDIISNNAHRATVTGNPHQVTKADVGLSNVPNTDFTAAVASNTAAQHTHTNKAILDTTTVAFTQSYVDAIAANTAKVGITSAQADAIVANTAKVGITAQQVVDITNANQHQATITGNPHHVTKAEVGLGNVPNVDFTTAVAANTAAQHTHVNKVVLDATTVAFTQAHVDTIVANTAKIGISPEQAAAIVANTAKVGITPEQAAAIITNSIHEGITSGNPHQVTKAEVGLGNVPNVDCTNASNITTGTLPTSVLPPLSITDIHTVDSQAEQLLLVVQKGDIAIRTDQNRTYINKTGSNTSMTDWQELSTPTDTILSVNGQTGIVILSTTNIAEGTNLYYTEARVTANTSVAANTAARHTHGNKAILDATTASFTEEQAAAIVANSAKVGITSTQADAIITNTAKVGITVQQAADIVSANEHREIVAGNPHQVTKSDVGLGNVPNVDFTAAIAANTADQHNHDNKAILDATTIAFNEEYSNAININTAKVGITQAQADAIVANTAKVGITPEQTSAIVENSIHSTTITGNPHQVTKADVGLGDVPNTDFTAAVAANTAAQHTHTNKAVLDTTTVAFTQSYVDTIAANTAKVGITPEQAAAIVVNSAKVGITEQQIDDITLSNTHIAIVTGNPHQVTKAEVGLGNVPNVDCTNASNITTGTLPSSVLPALAVVDTFVVASEVEQLALTVQKGDIAIRNDLSRAFINISGNNTSTADWQELMTPIDAILSVNGQTGTVILSTTDINEGANLYYTEERVSANSDVTANTIARHIHENAGILATTTVAFTQAYVDAIVVNSSKVGITPEQAAAIIVNTTKVGITEQQSIDIVSANEHRTTITGNPHNVTKNDVGLGNVPNVDFTNTIAANTAAQHTHTNKAILDTTTATFTIEQAAAIIANTAKVGITQAQADAIVANTAKVGITPEQAAAIIANTAHGNIVSGNPHQVTKSDVGLSEVPNVDFTSEISANTAVRHTHTNKAILDATTVAFTQSYVDVIVANSAKIGITQAQADAIVANTAKVGITPEQAAAIIANTAHGNIVSGNPHQVTKAEVGLGNVPNIDCTNASNITTGTLPSSVLPALAITDTHVVLSQTEQLALTVQKGDIAVRSDISKSFVNKTGNNVSMADWQELMTPTDTILSVNGQTGTVVLSTTNIAEGTNLYYTEARVTANTSVAANTAARHTHTNKVILDTTTVAFTQSYVDAIAANSAKVGITPAQASAIVANTAKVGITSEQAADIVLANDHRSVITGNPHQVTKTDIGLSNVPNIDFTTAVAANTAAQHTHDNHVILNDTTSSFTIEQAAAIIANTAKVGITQAQADAIVANTAKVGITAQQTADIILANDHRSVITGNPHQVTKTDIGLGNVPNVDFSSEISANTAARHTHTNKAVLDATTDSFTIAIHDAININTSKVGITSAQAAAIVANTAKVGITPQQTADIVANNTHRAITSGNPHQVTKAEVGLGNVPNVDCTNASNITTGTLPTSVLPPLAVIDTFVVTSEVEQLALTVQKGDIAVRTDINRSFINKTGNNTSIGDWQELMTPTDTVLSVNGQTGTVVLSTTNIAEGTNLYYTEARVTANTSVAANTSARHTHANKTALDNVSGINTGDQTSVTGNAGTATKLATARTINGIAFDGSANITIPVGTGDVTLTGIQTLTNKTLENVKFTKSVTEQIYNLTGTDLNPTNGTIQTKTLTGNTTFTSSIVSGQSMVLTLTMASAYTVTWPAGVVWVSDNGNVAPLISTGCVFVFWNISGTLYGTLVGGF